MNRAVTPQGKSLTIGLLWHSFSSDNLGVGALSQSQLAICTEAAAQAGVALRFVVFGTRGGSSYGLDDARLKIGNTIALRELVYRRSTFPSELNECDLVLDIGEGDSFADIYGFKRFLTFILTKVIVLAKRKPLILSPQTIGPFDSWYARLMATQVMKRCQKVFARDTLSFNYLRQVGLRDNVAEVVDVAFRLPYQAPAKADDGKVRIGINVSGLLFSGGYTGGNQFGLTLDYAALTRTLLTEWSKNPAHEIWLIPHVISDDLPRDDDRIASAQLKQEFPSLKLAPEFASPSEAKSFIAGMDFVTGARMHACIAAFSSGVPVVPIAYSRKFNGLFSMLGYSWVADAKAMNNADAAAIILRGFEQRAQLALEVQAGNQNAFARLDGYTATLAQIFRQVAERKGVPLQPAVLAEAGADGR
ncbi:polysaccharide pyruvyl transferase family protein [Duganella sp. LjRoot269]|jgi:polysaccharide pyruvyl transferase WcaK-like protein|uniref:polysaccharide pyruvyl transferase family protein n=1 Tax=Duganella sp. LjRoot269 TaxID=3342305 RepID=UPI003ECDC44D